MRIPFPSPLAGRPQVVLAPSHVLLQESAIPFGAPLGMDEAEAAWKGLVGPEGPELPAWAALDRRDTPTGTVWTLAFFPVQGELPDGDRVRPEALWAWEGLEALRAGREDGVFALVRPDGRLWAQVREGGECRALRGPFARPSEAWERFRREHPGALHEAPCPQPEIAELARWASGCPDAELRPFEAFEAREGRRLDRLALRRTAILVAGALCLAGAGQIPAGWERWRAARAEAALREAAPALERIDRLRAHRAAGLVRLSATSEALQPADPVAGLLSALARGLPRGARLEALTLERRAESDGRWTMRLQARLPGWAEMAPWVDGLRTLPGVARVRVEDQSSGTGDLRATLSAEGAWTR